jgi:hypothetical protein
MRAGMSAAQLFGLRALKDGSAGMLFDDGEATRPLRGRARTR